MPADSLKFDASADEGWGGGGGGGAKDHLHASGFADRSGGAADNVTAVAAPAESAKVIACSGLIGEVPEA